MMAHRLYRSAAMTAVSFTVLIMAGAAEAQTKRYQDCRLEPNRPVVQQRHMANKECMVMRRDGDVRSTGALTRAEARRMGASHTTRSSAVAGGPVARSAASPLLAQMPAIQQRDCRYDPRYPIAAPYWIDQNGCLRMRSGDDDVFVTGAISGRVTGP